MCKHDTFFDNNIRGFYIAFRRHKVQWKTKSGQRLRGDAISAPANIHKSKWRDSLSTNVCLSSKDKLHR